MLAAAAWTVMLLLAPGMLAFAVSVAVIDCVPAVFKVAKKLCLPAVAAVKV